MADQSLEVSFYLITQNPELTPILWEGLKKQANWTGKMKFIFFDPSRNLDTLVLPPS